MISRDAVPQLGKVRGHVPIRPEVRRHDPHGTHAITLSMLDFQPSTSISGGGVTGSAGPPSMRIPPTSPTHAVPVAAS